MSDQFPLHRIQVTVVDFLAYYVLCSAVVIVTPPLPKGTPTVIAAKDSSRVRGIAQDLPGCPGFETSNGISQGTSVGGHEYKVNVFRHHHPAENADVSIAAEM